MPTPVPTSVQGFNPGPVVATLGTPDFWTALLVAMLAGAIGGVIYELLILHGNIELPHKPSEDEFPEKLPYAVTRHVWDLGILARIFVGAAAAVAALLILNPETGFAFVATALIAGSTGTSILRSLQDRVIASLAVSEAARGREDAARVGAKVEAARVALAAAQAAAGMPAGAMGMPGPDGAAAPDLTEVDRLLSEAKGLASSISRR